MGIISKFTSFFNRRKTSTPKPFQADIEKNTVGEFLSEPGHYGMATGKLPNQQDFAEGRKLRERVKEAKNQLQIFRRDSYQFRDIIKELESEISQLEENIIKVERPQDFSKENVEKWKTIEPDDVTKFIYKGYWLPFHSTNVRAVKYDIDSQKMFIEFKGKGGPYEYDGISKEKAMTFLQAGSKGGWVWDNLRVRGSKTKHQVPYRKVSRAPGKFRNG